MDNSLTAAFGNDPDLAQLFQTVFAEHNRKQQHRGVGSSSSHPPPPPLTAEQFLRKLLVEEERRQCSFSLGGLLTVDMLITIFEYVPLPALVTAVSLVCQRWAELISNSPTLAMRQELYGFFVQGGKAPSVVSATGGVGEEDDEEEEPKECSPLFHYSIKRGQWTALDFPRGFLTTPAVGVPAAKSGGGSTQKGNNNLSPSHCSTRKVFYPRHPRYHAALYLHQTSEGSYLYLIGGRTLNEKCRFCERLSLNLIEQRRRYQFLQSTAATGWTVSLGRNSLDTTTGTTPTPTPAAAVQSLWETLPELAVARSAATCAVLGNALYVFGGFDGDRELSSIERLVLADLGTGSSRWEVLDTTLPTAHCEAALVRISATEVVLAGGCKNRDQPNEVPLNEVYLFDSRTHTFSPLPSFEVPRLCLGLSYSAEQSLLIVSGGFILRTHQGEQYLGESAQIEVLELNRSVRKSTSTTTDEKKSGSRASSLGGQSSVTGRWEPVHRMRRGKGPCTAICVGPRLYVAGGFTLQGASSTAVESYHLLEKDGAGAWEDIQPLPQGLDGMRFAATESEI